MITPFLILASATLGAGLGNELPHQPKNTAATRVQAYHADPDAGGPFVPLPVDATLEILDEVLTPFTDEARVPAMRVDIALDAMLGQVGSLSHPDALRLAFRAYYNFWAAHPRQIRNPYFYFVDFGLDNRTPRGYVFDMEALQVVDGPFTVAHGRGSSAGRDGVPTTFSNTPGSAATSLGLYLTREIYTFGGNAGGLAYRSVGLRLDGVSDDFNSMAYPRRVVAHGAPYVTPQEAGRSEGCPAMEQERASWLLPLIAQGGLVFLFSPLDSTWLQQDPWVNGTAGRVVTADR